jgi:trehalose 6-phosphate synthase
MPRLARFLVAVLASLALLTAIAYAGLTRVIGDWFERDLELRAHLAVSAARSSLLRNWTENPVRLTETLTNISHDERIMGAAACSMDGELLVATEGYPPEASCRAMLARRDDEAPGAQSWATSSQLSSGRARVSATVLEGGQEPLGVVLLVHDVSYLGRREETTRNLLLVAFFVLSLSAAAVTVVAARWAWRGWTMELKRALQGGASREFQPLLRDVRALVERLAHERDAERKGGPWSPERLRSTMIQHLHGERVVILANREPYIHEKTESGVRVIHPASGLVTALEPVMRACSGVWVAHGSGSADRDTVDGNDRVRVPPGEESYVVRRVWLSEEEELGYYYGFSNEGLWPLCHLAHTRPLFRTKDWECYVRVNRRFAETVCAEVDSDDPIVLVQDYHFALAPRMIRERLPRATIISFWHIPWPNSERFGICPWREDLLAGLLGSSIVGFHTQQQCNNFIDSVDAYMQSRIDRESNAVVHGERRTLIRAYPISIEWPVERLAEVPPAKECRAGVRRELGLRPDSLVGVGVDRLDYTKGIEERLQAVDELLERYPEYRGRFNFVQLAAPSRTKIVQYHDLNERIEALTRQINDKWARDDYRPIILLRAHHEPSTVFRYYRAADLCYVSSLHDGMNLVAKEFVAARDDERGVLILSQFTGAARDLTEALIVNPYDMGEAAAALAAALRMPRQEQRERMQSMRRFLSEFNVYRWAGKMLVDAAVLRRRERTTDRLTIVRTEDA